MSDQPFPAELRELLANHIDSIAQLEALLLLRHSQDVVWDVPGAAKRLYVGEPEALEALTHLAARSLITHDGNSYKFDPQSDELAGMIALLAEYYRAYLIPITNLIHAKPRRIQQFADAFKLKKD
jgi:hypothetical protein